MHSSILSTVSLYHYTDGNIFLHQPLEECHIPSLTIRRKIAKHLRTTFGRSVTFWTNILPQMMPHWAKLHIGNGGDLIQGAWIEGKSWQTLHDASFVRVSDSVIHDFMLITTLFLIV